ncbi:MAG: hypothetical protein C0391_03360 [Anaerolinea sp.]|nr:hypothetical protein [Anaerolinea sp.]
MTEDDKNFTNVVYCSKCGKQYPLETKFCSNCGISLGQTTKSVERSNRTCSMVIARLVGVLILVFGTLLLIPNSPLIPLLRNIESQVMLVFQPTLNAMDVPIVTLEPTITIIPPTTTPIISKATSVLNRAIPIIEKGPMPEGITIVGPGKDLWKNLPTTPPAEDCFQYSFMSADNQPTGMLTVWIFDTRVNAEIMWESIPSVFYSKNVVKDTVVNDIKVAVAIKTDNSKSPNITRIENAFLRDTIVIYFGFEGPDKVAEDAVKGYLDTIYQVLLLNKN